ncbi:MAG: hypothetical protein ACLRXI_06070 [Clostridia bacterium]|jgi:hypothetical protein
MNKKKNLLIVIIVISLVFIFLVGFFIFNRHMLKTNFENDILPFARKNQNTIFKINKITFFSSCDAKNKTASNSNFTIENLYQYTDIALFITSTSEEKTLENTLKKVSINNIKFTSSPTLGEPKLYYKNINNFAKSEISEENLINGNLDFNITSEDEVNLDKPTLYNNLANPIVLSYINHNIKTDYTITDTSTPMTYDGSLLKRCNILLNNIACSFSFDVYVTNNLSQEFKCTIYIDIPLDLDNQSIYNGNITLKKDTNFNFYRYR